MRSCYYLVVYLMAKDSRRRSMELNQIEETIVFENHSEIVEEQLTFPESQEQEFHLEIDLQQEFQLLKEPNLSSEQTKSIAQLHEALCDSDLVKEIAAIPDKLAFKIGDVAELVNVKQYVLRYWETEFDLLKPKKASNNQRMYSRKDVENALLIRKLLHRDRFSIEGARNILKDLKQQVQKEVKKEKDQSLALLKNDNILRIAHELVADIRRVRSTFK